MTPKAKWIWLDINPELARTNQTVLFHRNFKLNDDEVNNAVLQITADSRYRAFVNGIFIGEGPARGYPQHWRYDEYKLAAFMQPGENLLEVYVQRFGVSTFHYIDSIPGLLAAVCTQPDGQKNANCIIATDTNWDTRPAPEYIFRTPRISCQQDFEEQVDPDRANGVTWQSPTVVREQADDVHQDLKLRDVRQLSSVPVSFKRIAGTEVVAPLTGSWAIKLRETLSPAPRDANIYSLAGIYAAEFEIAAGAEIEWIWNGPITSVFLDGVQLNSKYEQGISSVILPVAAGRHILTLAIAEYTHEPDIAIGWRAKEKLNWIFAKDMPDSPWICIGPLWMPEALTNCCMSVPGKNDICDGKGDSYIVELPDNVREKIMKLASAENMTVLMENAADNLKWLKVADMSETDVLLNVRSDRILRSASTVTGADACLAGNAKSAVLTPDTDGDIRLLLDIDDVTIGWFEMNLTAPKGTVVDGYFFENMIDTVGGTTVIQHTDMHHNTFRYICREGNNNFLSRKRRGIRYAMLTFRNLTAPIQLHNVRVLEATYPVEARGQFHCSDSKLNRIYDISRRTLQLCMEDVFTDCPLYEQTLWIGDARNEAIFAHAAFWTPDIVWRCCRLGAQSLESLPLVGSQVPSGWNAILPAWSFLWGIMVWEAYFYTGDIKSLKEIYPAVMTNLRNAMMFCSDRGLFSCRAWNMFDWSGIDSEHKTVLHNSLFLVAALDAGEHCAEALDHKTDADYCRNSREKLKSAIEKMWDDEKNSYPDSIHSDGTISDSISQHTSVLALLYDVLEQKNREPALKNVLDPSPEIVQVGSPFALFYFLEALEKEEKYQNVMDLIRCYWGAMLDQNAKTCWETVHFDSDSFPTRSHCHGWSAAPVAVLPRMVLGVSPTSPGFKTARVCPKPFDLNFAKGTVPTPYGDIHVRWQKLKNGGYDLKVESPQEVHIEIVHVSEFRVQS